MRLLTRNIDRRFDAVVIGSGAAGSIAVKELTERGMDVLLLEAGRDIGDTDFTPPKPKAPRPLGMDLDLRATAMLAGQYRHAAMLSFQGIQRWRRSDGEWTGSFFVTKNHFDPRQRVGYQPASQYSNYNGSLMLRVDSDKPSLVWQSQKVSEMDTDGLHCVMATPLLENGYIYSPCSYGQFRCLKADNGGRIWETFEPTAGKSMRWGNAFIVKNGDRCFLLSETGDLIIAKLTPEKYTEISRAHLLDPTNRDPGRLVVWSHPAFANKSVYARNDREIVSVSLASEGAQ
jgi:hypothetical protein